MRLSLLADSILEQGGSMTIYATMRKLGVAVAQVSEPCQATP